jgi:hypothetical protein
MKHPNFFIIGAPKCGTTSLASWLGEHPEIFMSPVKEPHYFSLDFNRGEIKTKEDYDRLFEGAGPQHKAIGEASTEYFYSSRAVDEIEINYPGSRYIVMVRNPVDMAFSLYNYEYQGGRETIDDFYVAWQKSPERRNGQFGSKWCRDSKCLDYQGLSLFGEQLGRLLDKVDAARVHVIVFDDLKSDPQKIYQETLEFLGVTYWSLQKYFPCNEARSWASPLCGEAVRRLGHASLTIKKILGIPVYRGTGLLDRLSGKLKRTNRRCLDESIRNTLQAFYALDVKKIEELLGRDLSDWRRGQGL